MAQNERELLESSCRQAGVPVLLKPVLLNVQEPAWCGGCFVLRFHISLCCKKRFTCVRAADAVRMAAARQDVRDGAQHRACHLGG